MFYLDLLRKLPPPMNTPSPPLAFDRGNRTYWVSDERLREFGKLSVAERLRWVEESAQFVRLGQATLKVQLHADNAGPSVRVTGLKDSGTK
jgi:hypothetical protein